MGAKFLENSVVSCHRITDLVYEVRIPSASLYEAFFLSKQTSKQEAKTYVNVWRTFIGQHYVVIQDFLVASHQLQLAWSVDQHKMSCDNIMQVQCQCI